MRIQENEIIKENDSIKEMESFMENGSSPARSQRVLVGLQ